MKNQLKQILLLSIVVILSSFTSSDKKEEIESTTTSAASEQLKAAFMGPARKGFFLTDKKYYRQNLSTDRLEKKGLIDDAFKDLVNNIDAALLYNNGHAYFFKGSNYYRYSYTTRKINKEAAISVGWKGVPNNIDAAVFHSNGHVYFFKGTKYYRYNIAQKKVDRTALINKYWKGVPNNVDAALRHSNGKTYFFKGNTYYRYSSKTSKVDKEATIGVHGWKGLSFLKATKVTSNSASSSKNNIRLKVTLTRIKSIQARDSDDIADFLLDQTINYSANRKDKKATKSTMKRYRYYGENKYKDYQVATENRLIRSEDNHFHIREGDEHHYINNSLVFEITPQELKDQRAEFNIYTDLGESDGSSKAGFLGIPYLGTLFYRNPVRIKTIATKHFIDVNINEVLDYLLNPTAPKYGKSYFNGGRNGDMHEYGAFGDVMWFKKGSNNSLLGFQEFGANNKETYVRFHYRFELVP